MKRKTPFNTGKLNIGWDPNTDEGPLPRKNFTDNFIKQTETSLI